jgi:hypothetical protein
VSNVLLVGGRRFNRNGNQPGGSPEPSPSGT